MAALGLALVSGGSGTDPRTPAALPGQPPPFLGTAVAGGGGLTAAVDAYGDVVDLRPEPVGEALIDNPSARQAAGTVAAETGIVPRVSIGGGPALALWRADSVTQRYLPGTNVVRTVARFGAVRVAVTVATASTRLGLVAVARGDEAVLSLDARLEEGVRCARRRLPGRLSLLCEVRRGAPAGPGAGMREGAGRPRRSTRQASARAGLDPTWRLIRGAAAADRRWLGGARRLAAEAPAWAVAMNERSLLTLRALTGRSTGALAAGARDGWAYLWPRDAAGAALALEAAGYRALATRIARRLLDLDPETAARFRGRGEPVPGRGPQGDAAGWIAVAAQATGLPSPGGEDRWRDRPDYQEAGAGDYLGNAIAASASAPDVSELKPPGRGSKFRHVRRERREALAGRRIARAFETEAGLVRRAGDPDSGLDSAAAWAVEPFPLPSLFPTVRRTLLQLSADQTRFGIVPGAGWSGGVDPWSAPTAWSAWALAALARSERRRAVAQRDRRQALRLLNDLRRAATPAGAIPERVDARTGLPRSTTPLAWPHAFAILALRELWPPGPPPKVGASG